MNSCTHCNLPVPAGLVDPMSEDQFCCAGCRMALAGCGKEAIHILDFLLSPDWQSATRAKAPGTLSRYANRLKTKWAFKRMRPLGAE